MPAPYPKSVHIGLKNLVTAFPPTYTMSLYKYANAVLTKTRKYSHLNFLKNCLKLKHIPKGFQINFKSHLQDPGLAITCNRAATNCSLFFIKSHIRTLNNDILVLDRTIWTHKQFFHFNLDRNSFIRLQHCVHDINRLLYCSLSNTKNNKLPPMNKSSNDLAGSNTCVKVVCIPLL